MHGWGSSTYKKCTLDTTIQQLRRSKSAGEPIVFVTGGLGRFLVANVYEVWICLSKVDHPCARHGDHFCWVVDERIALRGERAPDQYVPWGYNSALELFNDTARVNYTDVRGKGDEPKQKARQHAADSKLRTRGVQQGPAADVARIPTAVSPSAGLVTWSQDQVASLFKRCGFPTEGVDAGKIDGSSLLELYAADDAIDLFTSPPPDGLGFNKLMFLGRFKSEMAKLVPQTGARQTAQQHQ